jgi:DNA repair protein RecO (recombination protein O)
MEWDAPAILLDVRPFGEGDALVALMTEAHGVHRGLARGGTSRTQAGLWQVGNLIQARWTGRLAEQLGSFGGEMIHPGAAHVMDDPMALAMLTAACAVTEGALPERQPHKRVFDGLLHLIPRLPTGLAMMADQIRWETTLLGELGYGLDLGACAVTGLTDDLAFVSPRTGRAVTRQAAGTWASRLLPLPGFLLAGSSEAGSPEEWRDGLRLTGHFLARDAFGYQNRPLPRARQMLYDRIVMICDSTATACDPAEPGRTDSETPHAG